MKGDQALELLATSMTVMAILAAALAALIRYLPRKRRPAPTPVPPAQAQHECVVSAADLAQLRELCNTLHGEVEKLRAWRHEAASDLGATRMIGSIMRAVNDLRERVARIEGQRRVGT